MDKDILKLLPQKAFKLLSIKETFKIGASVTKSIFDKDSYELNVKKRMENWKLDDIKIVKEFSLEKEKSMGKEDGEKILKVYFSQFFENMPVRIDLRKSSFSSSNQLSWTPSKIHYHFSEEFLEGVRELYKGFYFDDDQKFENGLVLLGIIQPTMSITQKKELKELFYKHFGEGKAEAVNFSLKHLQESFNAIFSFFLKEDIPLNPEFAVLGVYLVTLYLTLEQIPYALSVRDAFCEVAQLYQK